jgi:hypothetical protein
MIDGTAIPARLGTEKNATSAPARCHPRTTNECGSLFPFSSTPAGIGTPGSGFSA